jgi:RimJ/RimL family protein N-acetyltransferase
MSNPQLFPLKADPQTGEPFLRLRHHKSIILTPARWDDPTQILEYMNDPRVCLWLKSPPFPYLLGNKILLFIFKEDFLTEKPAEHAESWLGRLMGPSGKILQELEEAKEVAELKTVEGCPVSIIREVMNDGTQKLIGNVGMFRYLNGELVLSDGSWTVDWAGKVRREEENERRKVGDPEIIWSFGGWYTLRPTFVKSNSSCPHCLDWLAPSHHNQGIMTDAVETLLHDWAVPRMRVRHMIASAFEGNMASVKTFTKNGFDMVYTSKNHFEVKGKMQGLHVLEWKAAENLN